MNPDCHGCALCLEGARFRNDGRGGATLVPAAVELLKKSNISHSARIAEKTAQNRLYAIFFTQEDVNTGHEIRRAGVSGLIQQPPSANSLENNS